MPVVICRGEVVLRNPTNRQIAECLGFNDAIDHTHRARCDHRRRRALGAGGGGVRGVGRPGRAGPRDHCSGRAGRIELEDRELPWLSDWYLWPGPCRPGLHAGAEIRRAIVIAKSARELACTRTPVRGRRSTTTCGCLRARSSSRRGAAYRRLDLENLSQFEGAGVYYGATFIEAQVCRDDELVVVGGGNAAGQAAVFLAQTAKHVYMLVRGAGLAATMSRYLIRRIEDNPAITLRDGDGDRRARRWPGISSASDGGT